MGGCRGQFGQAHCKLTDSLAGSPANGGIGATFIGLREDAPPFEGTGRLRKRYLPGNLPHFTPSGIFMHSGML
ncbi:hypothetical protein CHISP_3691 [Chitinispirillum alkaliphilum]|nr:hypothetical protein CHISP_3691 [Chitinispirillum alkaliphilum]